MENASIKKTIEFVKELESLNQLNGEQIMDYAQWAGRLSSLGYKTYLDDFFQRFDSQTVNTLLKHRIHKGLEDIKEAYGKYLAVEIFTVQDFSCFVKHAPEGIINQSAKDFMNFWIQTAELQRLNEEASQTLKAYLESYPIAEEDQLDIIAAPLTEKALLFWNVVLEPLNKIIEIKSKKLKKQIHIEKVNSNSDNGQISIRISGVNPQDIVKVRYRFVPALRSKTDPSEWAFDFDVFGITPNGQENIVVYTKDGAKASVPYASIEKTDSPSVGRKFVGVRQFERSTNLAAADSEKSDKILMSITGLDDIYLKIWFDKPAKQIIVQARSSQNNRMTDKLDGWSLFGKNGIFLGTFNGKTVRYPYSDENIPVLLKDKNGTSYLLTIKEEN